MMRAGWSDSNILLQHGGGTQRILDCSEKYPFISNVRTGCQNTTEEIGGGLMKHDVVHSKKTWKIWVLGIKESACLTLTEPNGDFREE